MESGPADRRSVEPDALIPDVLLHAIGWVESTLNQTAIHVPYESVGPVLISRDCAYGVMQVASAFSNHGDTPSRTEALTGTHYAYNIAAGARILIAKWNEDLIPVVGMGSGSSSRPGTTRCGPTTAGRPRTTRPARRSTRSARCPTTATAPTTATPTRSW